ncbi:MAG TPA: DUF4097 family beta strand repeat-containing protein [Lacunisphaera sp.]
MNLSFRTPPRLLLVLAAAALLAPALRAADDESDGSTARVTFSDATKPGTLKCSLPWAEVHVIGTDGHEVVVTSSLDQKGKAEVDHEGFRRLDTDVTFELVEKDNVAVITVAGDNLWATQGSEFEIKVPRNTNLVLRTEMGGEVEVNGVEGDLDINSMNGEVTLRDIASSAVVNTLNGEISASFKRAPVKPVSFSTMNGEIDVRLPSDTKANLKMRTHNGSIRTNFPDGVLQAKTEKTSSRVPGAPSADTREAQREMQRDLARAEREQARAIKEAAKAAAEAARAAVDVAADVNVNVDAVAPVPPVPPVPPIPPMPSFGGKSIVGTLNGGGIDIKLTSMNGTITVRESK